MAAAAPAKIPLQWSAERWRLLVLASAAVVLEAREKRMPFKEQLAVPLVIQGEELKAMLPDATSARRDMADHAEFLDGVRARMAGSAGAPAVIETAFVGCQLTPTKQQPAKQQDAPRCVFTQSPVCDTFRLFGNRDGRAELPVTLSPEGRRLVEACMVVGNVREWLDQEVTHALGPSRRILETTAELDEIGQLLAPSVLSFHLAAQYIYTCCKGPIPQSPEETRRAALPVWEALTDIHEMIRTAHLVLWSDVAWKPSPLTSTPEELGRAYRSLSKRMHPDKVSPARKDEATHLFRTLHRVYEEHKERQ